SGTGEMWTLYVHCKNGLPDQEYVMFKVERPDIKFSTLTSLKDQLGYAVRDFLYYKKRCGRDVATLQPLDYVRHAEIMLQDNESEKEIRLVLSKEQETAQQVSITPLKRPRQQLEEDEHPFMDDPFDAYKDWLKKLPQDQSKNLKDDTRDQTVNTYKEFLRMKGDIPEIMAFVEQRDTDGIIVEDDESNGSNATPPSNRPSHARKARDEGNGHGSNQRKKRGRGTVKGFTVGNKRVKERTQKLPIEFSERRGGPIGPNTRAFVDEVVLFTRKWAPLIGVNSWKDIKEQVKKEIADEILLRWNFINIDDEDKRKEKIWNIAKERYKGWRSALSATYRAYNSYGERIRNKPEEIHLLEWHYLQLYFGSDKFKKVSSQNSSNRQQQRTRHLMGSKNFSQCSFEQRDQETGEEPSDLLLWRTTHTKHGRWSNSVSASVYENAAMKIGEIGLEPDRQTLTTVEENMIFQSCYKETTQIKSSKLHGHGYLATYRTHRELMKENLEVHARAQAAAREKSIAFEAEVEKLKEQIAQEAAEREREKEENRRRMQEELENAKINIREEMKQEFLNMLAQHKEGTMNMSTPQNNASIQVAPSIQEEDGTGEHETENEDGLQETQPGSVVTVQKDAPAPTRSSKSTAQLMNRTRNNPKRRK
ncbi:hypothetical protein E2562_017766, partial [Oryza meyeriana var. granulata]